MVKVSVSTTSVGSVTTSLVCFLVEHFVKVLALTWLSDNVAARVMASARVLGSRANKGLGLVRVDLLCTY